MKKNKKTFYLLIFVHLISIVFNAVELKAQADGYIQIQQMVHSVEGIAPNEQHQLIENLFAQFRPKIEQAPLNEEILKNTSAIISAGMFEQAQLATIAEVAFKAYLAEENRAPAAYVRDLSLIGMSTAITADQLEMAARGIEQLMNAGVEPVIVEDFISYSLYNGWSGETIREAVSGMISGQSHNLRPKRLALCLIVSIDRDISNKSAREIVPEAIQFLKELNQKQPLEAQRQERAYQLLQQTVSQGVPKTIAEEIYFTALAEKWEASDIQIIFDGLIRGQQRGLTPERLATAIIVRKAQAGKTVPTKQIVNEEIKYVTNLEKKRSQVIQNDQQKYQRKPIPIDPSLMSSLEPRKVTRDQPFKFYNSTNRATVSQELMWQTIQEYLGPPSTPYRWGGTSKSGIDCSGFTLNIYREQGIYLPRTSSQQYHVGMPVTSTLQFGDLVFFSKYGPAYQVTHVGIYIGGDKFVHSSASKGVTINSLNKNYYRLRFKGARRIVL